MCPSLQREGDNASKNTQGRLRTYTPPLYCYICGCAIPTFLVLPQPYMAPELFRSDDADLKYGEKVDVWAVGVVTHELLACVTPFRSVDNLFVVDFRSCQRSVRSFHGTRGLCFQHRPLLCAKNDPIFNLCDSNSAAPRLTGRLEYLQGLADCIW